MQCGTSTTKYVFFITCFTFVGAAWCWQDAFAGGVFSRDVVAAFRDGVGAATLLTIILATSDQAISLPIVPVKFRRQYIRHTEGD